MAHSDTTSALRTTGGSVGDGRILALDGLRGVMTIAVVVSHYFAELPSGIAALSLGWFAVIGFFVLSGFLVGRMILDKQDRANFFTVFYVRRVCRMMPAFFVAFALILGVYRLFDGAAWLDADHPLPTWSYALFVQNFFIVSEGTVGAHWLAPTWTLAVEEHFYLVAPAMLVFLPRRYLLQSLLAASALSVGLRAAIELGGSGNGLAAHVMLPALADTLAFGIIAAVLLRTEGIDWSRFDFALRAAPIPLLLLAAVLKLIDGETGHLFHVFGTTLVAAAGAVFMLAIVRDAPEAQRLKSPILRFFGDNSYCIYLTHLTVLGVMHGLILGTRPDLATSAQVAVSLAALPVATVLGWALTKGIEEPCSAYGRTWKWSRDSRVTTAPALIAAQAA